MLTYSLSNGKSYNITNEKGHYRVEEFDVRFDKFYTTTGNIVYLDNMREVREYLTEMNGGVEVYG